MRQSGAAVIAPAMLAALIGTPLAARAAGPCTDDIATLRKQLGNASGLGAPVSEPSAGLTVGNDTAQTQSATTAPKPSDRAQPGGASLAAGGSPGTVGGVAGPTGTSAIATGQVATSAEDVRRQSEGKPTTAQQAASGQPNNAAQTTSDDKVSQAKMALQRAVDLNAKDDASCKSAISEAQNLMPKQ